MNVPDLYKRAVYEFDRRLQSIKDDQWDAATPCTEWTVRDVVNHMVNENKWVPPLLAGKTIEQVGDAFDDDLLGDDPKAAWRAASQEALAAAHGDGAMDVTAHLSFGDFPGHYYIGQLLSDHTIHAWDVARAVGAAEELDRELVAFAHDFLAPESEQWRQVGIFGPEIDVPGDADPQTKLLALVGREA